MKIYVAHSRDFDYINELYIPLKQDIVFEQNDIILPHDTRDFHHEREYYKDIDLYIAEVSYPATGVGMELGFAYDDGKEIYCIYKEGSKISSSIEMITSNLYSYKDIGDMINKIKMIIDDTYNKTSKQK